MSDKNAHSSAFGELKPGNHGDWSGMNDADEEDAWDGDPDESIDGGPPLMTPFGFQDSPPVYAAPSSQFRDQIKDRRQSISEAMKGQGHIPFEELPSVQSLREAWKIRGLDEHDPVFLLVEVCAYWDERSRERLEALQTIVESQEAINSALADSINRLASRLETHENFLIANTQQAHDTEIVATHLSEQIKGSNTQTEAMTTALRATVDCVGDRTLLTQVLQYAIPLIVGVIGIVLGLLLRGFF